MNRNWQTIVELAVTRLERLLDHGDGEKFTGYITPEEKVRRIQEVEKLLADARTV